MAWLFCCNIEEVNSRCTKQLCCIYLRFCFCFINFHKTTSFHFSFAIFISKCSFSFINEIEIQDFFIQFNFSSIYIILYLFITLSMLLYVFCLFVFSICVSSHEMSAMYHLLLWSTRLENLPLWNEQQKFR